MKHPERMEKIMQAVCADCGAQLREFNGGANYVHLLVNGKRSHVLAAASPGRHLIRGCVPAH